MALALSPLRALVAALALLPIVGLGRLARDSNLHALDLLQALGGDALLLATLFAIGWFVRRRVVPGSFSGRLISFILWLVAAAVPALLVVAELLHRRTGELLDVDIIRFALAHFADVHGAVGSALAWNDLGLVLIALAVVAVFAGSVQSRAGQRLTWSLLALPWGLLGAHVAYDAWAFDASPVMVPIGDYQGRYAEWKVDHEAWLAGQSPWYRNGMLTGLAGGKVLSSFELQALEGGRNEMRPAYVFPQGPLRPKTPFNVLVVALESIRHDVVGAYGAGAGRPSVTPFIDSLAGDGWRVERAYTTIPHTSKALVGIFCGTFPVFSPLVAESRQGGLPLHCLPKLLASAGYATAHFQTAPAEFEDRTGLLTNLGFATQMTQESFAGQGWARFGYIAMDDRAMVKPAAAWMQAQQRAGKPFFASVLTVLTHHPYASPVASGPLSDPAVAYQRYVKALGYTDGVLAELFAAMRQAGVLDNTLVVVTGDHGEAFSEHGLITHNGVPYEEVMRVPLILWGKMLGEPKVVRGLRQHIDVMPTVLDLLGAAPGGALPGISLRDPQGHRRLINACFYLDYCLNIYDEDVGKTVFFYGKRKPAHFDLASDAGERGDRIGSIPAERVREQMAAALALKRDFERVFDRE